MCVVCVSPNWDRSSSGVAAFDWMISSTVQVCKGREKREESQFSQWREVEVMSLFNDTGLEKISCHLWHHKGHR